MPVIDASVVVEFLAGAEHAEVARERLRDSSDSLWAPHLIDAEAGHALRRLAETGELDAIRAGAAIEDLAELPIRRVTHTPLLAAAWGLRHNVSFYDALYVALALALDTRLITFDARLARDAPTGMAEMLA